MRTRETRELSTNEAMVTEQPSRSGSQDGKFSQREVSGSVARVASDAGDRKKSHANRLESGRVVRWIRVLLLYRCVYGSQHPKTCLVVQFNNQIGSPDLTSPDNGMDSGWDLLHP